MQVNKQQQFTPYLPTKKKKNQRTHLLGLFDFLTLFIKCQQNYEKFLVVLVW